MNFKNESDAERYYDEHYGLQVLLDEVWYEIPTISGDGGFHDITFVLPKNGEQSKTYSLELYGELSIGTYRKRACDMHGG